MMKNLFYFIEKNLLALTLITTALGLYFPILGIKLSLIINPLLASLMLTISLTFDLHAAKKALRRPKRHLLAVALVYGPMSLMAWIIGRLFFGQGQLAAGQTLVGLLPTDVSAPLLVLLARGNVALAAVLNAINTALSPFITPLLFVIFTGLKLQISLSSVITELALVIILPTIIGVFLRTRYLHFVSRYDVAYPSLGSLFYLLLLLTVLGPNAQTILDYKSYALVIAAAALLLNLLGYATGYLAKYFVENREELIAYLFTVSKKEFSIAVAFISASGLPSEIAVPAAFYAVIQMVTSPIAAKLLTRKYK